MDAVLLAICFGLFLVGCILFLEEEVGAAVFCFVMVFGLGMMFKIIDNIPPEIQEKIIIVDTINYGSLEVKLPEFTVVKEKREKYKYSVASDKITYTIVEKYKEK